MMDAIDDSTSKMANTGKLIPADRDARRARLPLTLYSASAVVGIAAAVWGALYGLGDVPPTYLARAEYLQRDAHRMDDYLRDLRSFGIEVSIQPDLSDLTAASDSIFASVMREPEVRAYNRRENISSSAFGLGMSLAIAGIGASIVSTGLVHSKKQAKT